MEYHGNAFTGEVGTFDKQRGGKLLVVKVVLSVR